MRLYTIPLIGSVFILFSCSAKKEVKDVMNTVVKKEAVGIVNNDSVAPPVITKADPPLVAVFTKTVEKGNAFTAGKGKNYFTGLTQEKGYSIGSVSDMIFDKDGMAWLAAESGLMKYDGVGFTRFGAKNGAKGASIISIIKDNKGDIWMTSYTGLSRFDGYRFYNYDEDPVIGKNHCNDLNMDHLGNLWFTMYGKGICKFDGNAFASYSVQQGLPSDMLSIHMIDKEGKLWISTRLGEIGTFDGKTYTVFQEKTINEKQALKQDIYVGTSVFQDRQENIWISSGAIPGVRKFDGKGFTSYTTSSGLLTNYANSIAQDSSGNIWFTGEKGVSRFDGNHFTNYTNEQGLINAWTQEVITDPAGNIWLRGWGGLNKFNGGSISHYTTAEGFRGTEAGYVNWENDRYGNLWFTILGGIGKYDGHEFTYYVKQGVDPEKRGNNLGSLYLDKEENIWFSTGEKGCYRFDGKTFLFYPEIITQFDGILQDSKGAYWFTDYRTRLMKFDGTSYTYYQSAQGLPSDHSASIIGDRSGNIWLGGFTGISKFDGKKFTNYTTNQDLDGNAGYRLMKDQKGQLWFSSDSGLVKFEGRSFTYFETADGFSNNLIDQMIEDTINKKIWVTTGYGLSAINTGIIDGNTGKELVENYNFQTGFPGLSKQFNGIIQDRDGVLWLSDVNKGLTRFDYGQLKKYKVPKLIIKDVRLDNETICWHQLLGPGKRNNVQDSFALRNEMNIRFQKELSGPALKAMSKRFAGVSFDSISPGNLVPFHLKIPFRHNSVGFEFAAIDPANAGQFQYQYMLEGYDRSWSKPDYTTKANFGNISEGHYTFRLKARSPNGQWSETSYSFRILPPWYRTWWAYTLYAVTVGLGIFLFIRWRTSTLKKEKIILEEKVSTRTSELKESLEHLKATQSQLIQSEKMASLGELTAGIAHEIQNPLNFVNNFSEINTELIDEASQEMKKGNISEANSIMDDIKENEQKINHHGKRADAIVKGMLQHSSGSNGQKEPTDIKELCDEYLRLAYHGLRAKDKSFQAELKTDFDPAIGKISLVPQDIGRVLLNLINNAFYAVNEREKLIANSQQLTASSYEPVVSVSTKKTGNNIEIRVADNGNGIPQKVLDKIFQPFFTTKPTGQGTGLGLSLSYDIVKAHGGELTVRTPLEKVQTTEGGGTEFTITLPFKTIES